MSIASTLHRLPFWAGLLLVAGGCGSRETRDLTPVVGKVAYHGKPVGMGTIVFVPDPARGTTGDPICAEIQGDGAYQLKTGSRAGVPAGWYRVTVAAVSMVPAPGPAQAPPHSLPYSLLPDKYRDPELSGLMCEVKAGRENAIHFNLE